MKRKPAKSNDNQLVYRESLVYLWIGLAAALAGTTLVVCVVFSLVASWPFDINRFSILWFGSTVLAIGLPLLRRKQVALDRTRCEIVRTTSWVFGRRSTTEEMGELKSVTWAPNSTTRNGIRFSVRIATAQENVHLFQVPTEDKARQIAREVAQHFDIPEETWERQLLTSTARPEAGSTLERGTLALLHGASRWKVKRTATRFTYFQMFDAFCFVFALIALPMGGGILIGYGLGFDVAKGDDVSGPLIVAIFFICLSIVFLFGQRGITVDKHGAYANKWIGLIVPMWSTWRELPRFTGVAFERVADTINGHPTVIGRVALVGDAGNTFILWKSIDQSQARWLAGEIAEFLNYPIVERTAEQAIDEAI